MRYRGQKLHWTVPRELLWAIIFGLAVTVASLLHALKQHPPYAPQINTEQQANGALKSEQNAKGNIDRPSETNEENGGKHADQREDEGTEFWPSFMSIRLKITDSLLAAFTLGLLIFTGLLWSSTEKLWVETRDTGKRQEADTRILERAYLAVSPRGIHSLSGTSIDICVAHICIRNVGRLPARSVTWFITSTISESPVFKEMEVDRNLAAGEVTIAPGIEAVQGGDIIFASDLEKAKASQPTGFCYVWGVVYYLDGFDQVRVTRFCHRYNCADFETIYDSPPGGLRYIKGKTIAAETARIHRYGNDAT